MHFGYTHPATEYSCSNNFLDFWQLLLQLNFALSGSNWIGHVCLAVYEAECAAHVCRAAKFRLHAAPDVK